MSRIKTAEQKKAEWERHIFRSFASSAKIKLDPRSIRSLRPPHPDIRCQINSKLHYFELGEITSQGLASGVARSIKTGEITGGSFSQDEPFTYILNQKESKKYRIRKNGDLELLLYYDKQYPPPEDWNLPSMLGTPIAKRMIQKGPWKRIWVYDDWKKKVIWKCP
jgi:hypothetical protein